MLIKCKQCGLQVPAWGTETGDQRGGEWEPIKISSKFETSVYVPKSPQALEPRSARIAMDKLSRSRRPRSQRGSKASRNAELDCRDRSDRLHRPVRPVGLGIQIPDRSDRSLPDSPPTKLQMSNLEQTKSKSNETWREASHLPHEHIPKRSRPKDQRILRIRGEIKKDWGFLKNSRTSILKS